MGQLGICVRLSQLSPFFLLLNYFRKYSGWNSSVVSFSLHVCRTIWQDTQNCSSNHAFFVLFPLRPPKFWGRVEQIFQNGPANIWAHENWKQIFGYFKLRFHNELLHWQKNRFLVFFRAGLHLHVRKISTLSVKQFKLFAKISYIFDN